MTNWKSPSLTVAVVVLALLAATAHAMPKHLSRRAVLSAEDEHWNSLNEQNADLEALAYEAGVEFGEASEATPKRQPQSKPLPPPGPFAGSEETDAMVAAQEGQTSASQGEEELVTGLGKELRFRMHNAAEVVALVKHAKKVGMKVDAELEAQLGEPTAFNSQGLDARQQLQAGKRKAIVNAVKASCSAAWDKISMKASLSIAGSFTMGASTSAMATFGASGKAEMKITGTISIECSDLKVCSKCLWQAMLLVVVPGYGMFKSVGNDVFAQPTTCEPQLFGWCTSFVHRWICDQEVLEGIAVHDAETLKDVNYLTACEDDLTSDTTKLYSKRRCQDFERFLRPLRPDLMRYMKCDMTRGWTKGWRKFAEFGRGVVGRITPPYLRQYALKKLDDHHSTLASRSTFSCPLTAHSQAHMACAYYLPLLDIPALASCEGDPKAMDEKSLSKYVNKEQYKLDNPNSVAPVDSKTGGKVDGKVDGAGCFNEAFDYARKTYFDGNSDINAVNAPAAVTTTPPESFTGTFLAKMKDKKACSDLNKKVAAVPAATLKKWLWPICTNPNHAKAIGVCESQALVCAAVVKVNAANNYWSVSSQRKKKRIGTENHHIDISWFGTQKISVTDVCNSLEKYAPGIAHRCRRFKEVNRQMLPYLMLGTGCKLPAHSVEVETEQGTDRTDVICSAPADDVDETILNNAFKACLESRNDLALPIMNQCTATGTGGDLPNYTVQQFDYRTSLETLLAKLKAIDTRKKIESSLFYRVLDTKKVSVWDNNDIFQPAAPVEKWDAITTQPEMCKYVAGKALEGDNDPCGGEKALTSETNKQTWCKTVREQLYQMSRQTQGKWKGLHNLDDMLMSFLYRHVALATKANFLSYANAATFVCLELKKFQNDYYASDQTKKVAANVFAAGLTLTPVQGNALPECDACKDYGMRLLSNDATKSSRKDAMNYFVEHRLNYVLPKMYKLRGDKKKTITTFDAIIKGNVAANTWAQDVLDVGDGTQVCGALAADDAVWSLKAKAVPKAECATVGKAVFAALAGTGGSALGNAEKRVKAYCQWALPHCVGYLA